MPRSNYYVGALSGTSVDALDLAIVSVHKNHIQLIHSYSHPFPEALRLALHQLCTPGNNELVAWGLADRNFALEVSKGIKVLLQQAGLAAEEITAIGSHGQTVRHHPEQIPAFSLQLGCPATIAAETGIAVVSHFRQKDIALGGQGAPLAPAFHQALFHSTNEDRAVINLGGIANISYLPIQGDVTGFDCGPANTLLDAWYQMHHSDQNYDADGQWARTGKVSAPLLKRLLQDPYFQLLPPKSTGREYFTLKWLQQHLNRFSAITAKDVQATLLELTARSLTDALAQFAPAERAFLCGGGVHNAFLMERLQALSPQVQWQSTRLLGVDPDWVEAMLFAWLAYRHVAHLSGNLTAVTGAARSAVLGSYTPAQ